MKIIFLKNCIFVWLDASPPVFPKDFFNKNGTSPGPPQQLPRPPCPTLFVTTDKEQAPQGTGQSSIPDDDVFPYGRFCRRNIENAFVAERSVTDRRTD